MLKTLNDKDFSLNLIFFFFSLYQKYLRLYLGYESKKVFFSFIQVGTNTKKLKLKLMPGRYVIPGQL